MIDAVRWHQESDAPLPGRLRLLDQTRLPEEHAYVLYDDVEAIYDAIQRLVVRGAPAIGIAAGFGLVVATQHCTETNAEAFANRVRRHADYLASARPTAVNLSWALRRCCRAVAAAADKGMGPTALKVALLAEAQQILDEDIAMCRAIGRHGASLLGDGMGILTHCNAGALATGDYGTALSPIYVAHEAGLKLRVFADETRPLLQGSRLTAWELHRAGVDVTVLCDNMAAQLMASRKVDLVIVGADRIAANGDAANKIGTYGLAVLARYHNIPMYIAAPSSTLDLDTPSGAEIPIEQRAADEVRRGFGKLTAPADVKVYSPAFDVTPADLIAGIITEKGICRTPYPQSLRECVQE